MPAYTQGHGADPASCVEARLCPPVSINQHEDALNVTQTWNLLDDPAQLLLPHWLRWQLPVGRAAPQLWCGTLARPLCAWAQSPPCLSHQRLLLSGLFAAPWRDRPGKRPREGVEGPQIDCRKRSSSWCEACFAPTRSGKLGSMYERRNQI